MVSKRNPMARDLRQPKYKPRVVQDKKRKLKSGYTKHKSKHA